MTSRRGRSARRARKRGTKDEPDHLAAWCDDVVEYGGELILVAGHTAGGVPFGIPYAEVEDEEIATSTARWARAKRALGRAFFGGEPDVGRVHFLGQGLARTAWIADVQATTFSGAAVALLPHDDVDESYGAKVRRESQVLARLAQVPELPFRAPRPLALLVEEDRPVLVEQWLPGRPLDMRAPRRPWRVIARLAAAVHALDVTAPGPATRRSAVLAAVAEIEAEVAQDTVRDAVVIDAIQFARAALAAPELPSAFVHGDLLSQNILLDLNDERPALIDFEHAARGDPALDLAVVTRGVRRPFQVEGGLERLLDEYGAAGGVELTARDVHVQEALMLAGQAIAQRRRSLHATPPALQTLASLLKRV